MVEPRACSAGVILRASMAVHELVVGGSAFAGRPSPTDWLRFPRNGQPRQALAVLGFLAPKHRGELLQIMAALSRDFVANAPDFFQYFMFHNLTIPSIRGAYRLPGQENPPPRKSAAVSRRLQRWRCAGSST